MSERKRMMEDKQVLDETIGMLSVEGNPEQALVNILYGLSPYHTTVLPQLNDDDKTYVFFTRPDMNLSGTNAKRDRKTVGILKDSNSVHKYTRLLLDQYANMSEQSNVLDKHNPFMPIFSNTLETLSGFPDIVMESWLSKTGIRKDQFGYADGYDRIHYSFELDATFTNVIDEPVAHIVSTWMRYMSNVRSGIFLPHRHNYLARRIDYQTAIWVIVTNKNKRIKKIAKTIGYPIADPQGRFFNYSRTESKISTGSKLNTRFKCFGVDYNDPILLVEFNAIMMAAHPKIRDMVIKGGKEMVEVPDKFKSLFNYRSYPFIDLRYNTLETIVDTDYIKIKDIPNDR